ncbi:MAG: murein DD-endopeptidase MepM/ murein hydrolase activator NlpD [Cryomorphaceae bacterium]|jgi:murein DD-endopeptidase MepM/ murein hydrolase activator NlpD
MTPVLTQLSKLLSVADNPSQGQSGRIKKRHWVLGSMVILVGSWITHTTTATISSGSVDSQIAPFTDLSLIRLSEIDSAGLVETLEASAPISPQALIQAVESESYSTVTHKVKRGESLGVIFRKLGLDLSIPHQVSQHDVAKQLVSLSIGKTLSFKLDENQQLKKLIYPSSALQELVVSFEQDQISDVHITELAYSIKKNSISGEISSSLYEAALEAGMSNGTIMEMVRIFGWDIDFVQDIRVGDSFHVVHTDYILDEEKIANGNILAAEFTTQGQTYQAIRFEDAQGGVSYYTPQGKSMLGTFLRSPVEFSRISSRFGKRRHPISKKWKAHKGVDYAAGRGTPIRATADGKVVHAGNKGGYGKTIVLRHAGRFSTLYAHMNGYAKGVRSGSRVEQGQVIGYVGTTGYSTGPHLHYEFRVDGVHRNSLTYKTPKASSVHDEQRSEFNQIAQTRLGELATVATDYQLAKVQAGSAQL